MLCKKSECPDCPLYLTGFRNCVLIGINSNISSLNQNLKSIAEAISKQGVMNPPKQTVKPEEEIPIARKPRKANI